MDAWGELVSAYLFVEQGTVNAEEVVSQYSVGDSQRYKELKRQQKVIRKNINPQSQGQWAQPKRNFGKQHAE